MKEFLRPFGWVAVAVLLSVPVLAGPDMHAAPALKYESGMSEEPLRRLEQLLRDSAGNPARRAEGESALIRMLAADASFEAKRFACYTLAVYGTETSVPALAALLKQDETVGIACFALGRLPCVLAGDHLRAAVAEAKGVSRVQIVVTLGQRAEAESVKPLIGLLRDGDAAVVRAAVHALGNVDTAEAREAVSALRREADSAYADVVAGALLAFADKRFAAGDPQTAAALCADCVGADFPPHVRRGAFGMMLKCDADEGLERIRKTLEAVPPDPVLAPVAVERVAALSGGGVSKEFGGLLPRLPRAEQTLLIEALACRGDADARAAIRTQVGAADSDLRRAAVAAVGKLEDASAVAMLVQAVKAAATPDEEKDVRSALVNLRGGEAVDQVIVEALRRAAGTDKLPLVDVLSRRGGRTAVPVLLELSVSADEPVARAAGQGLVRIADGGDAASLESVQIALADGDIRKREAALHALAAWRGVAAWDTVAHVYASPGSDAQRALSLRGLVRMAGEGNAQPDAALIARYRQLLAGARSDADRRLILNTLAGVAHPDALALALPLLDVPGLRAEVSQAVERMARSIQNMHPDVARDAMRRVKGE
ncbi:MAG TPA: HEAT repeat domain-containing protein [Kiritimatiellia bacterium]|nr:HEAT repeat domain-containing protein [Kiritimatiellia bacterium]HPS07958.1 HEAT repeat domain-containing protein [Kiritimatiellia bacterium]